MGAMPLKKRRRWTPVIGKEGRRQEPVPWDDCTKQLQAGRPQVPARKHKDKGSEVLRTWSPLPQSKQERAAHRNIISSSAKLDIDNQKSL